VPWEIAAVKDISGYEWFFPRADSHLLHDGTIPDRVLGPPLGVVPLNRKSNISKTGISEQIHSAIIEPIHIVAKGNAIMVPRNANPK
jgi:hypothetical protein